MPVELLAKKSISPVEPALVLDEIEKEHPGQLQEGECMPVPTGHSARKLVLRPVEGSAELPKEPNAKLFRCEGLGPREASGEAGVRRDSSPLEAADIDGAGVCRIELHRRTVG